MTRSVLLILAAGGSTRLGRPKQLLKYKGSSLLMNAVASSENSSFERTVVVVGANEQKIREHLLNTPVEIVENPSWEEGISSSIKKGVEHIINSYDPEFIGIAVADQPFINSSLLDQLLDSCMASSITVFSSYDGKTTGVPAVFIRKDRDKLLGLEGDRGARALLMDNKLDHEVVEFPAGLIDIDTDEDYQELLNS